MEKQTLRLITLNTWCGRSLYPLMKFLKNRVNEIDIFCLQEVYDSDQEVVDDRHPGEYLCGALFGKINKELEDFNGSFAYFDDEHNMSLAMFWRKSLGIKEMKDFLVYKCKNPIKSGGKIFDSRKLQYSILDFNGKELLVANYHGLWNGGPKTDTPERIEQSKTIKEFLDKFNGPKILCGDFNLLPDTESIGILEMGMRNLVKEYGVDSTRTVLYRSYYDLESPNFADYIFVSPNINVKDFKVLPDIVSDHAPLYLEIDID